MQGMTTQRESHNAMRPVPRVEVITPTDAEKFLLQNRTNRPLKRHLVVHYSLEMQSGRWAVNGETIKFDDSGSLIDGQHRLHACVLSQKAFSTYAVRGITDPKAFSTIDTGRSRSHGDIFALAGFGDPNNASGAALLLYYYKKNLLTQHGPKSIDAMKVKKMTNGTDFAGAADKQLAKDVLLEFALPMKEPLEYSLRTVSRSNASRFATKTTLGACHYLFAEKSITEADLFIKDLSDGAGLTMTDAVYHLRERLAQFKAAKFKPSRWEIFHLIVKAWNKRRAGERVRTLRITEGEELQRVK
jgi:hypothetical protein